MYLFPTPTYVGMFTMCGMLYTVYRLVINVATCILVLVLVLSGNKIVALVELQLSQSCCYVFLDFAVVMYKFNSTIIPAFSSIHRFNLVT